MTMRIPFMRRLLSWRGFCAVNLLLAAFVAAGFGREYVRQRGLHDEIAGLQRKADELSARQFDLFALTSSLRTESYIEREARLKLGLKRPGEAVVVVRDGPAVGADEPSAAHGPDEAAPAVANSAKWWYYFFDRETYQSLVDAYGTHE